VLAPGASFTKTWRITNVGSCTWTTDYDLVFVSGSGFGAASAISLPSSVAPGATADFSVNMVAPSVAGHYRSYWRFRNAAGTQFGVGSGMITFFADIYVSSTGSASSTTAITADTPDPSAPGHAVAVSVTVSGAGATPTGTVAVTGADTNCTITLSSGSGSCNVTFNTAGAKTILATYSGNTTYITSLDTTGHTVSGGTAASTTGITTDTPDPSIPGQSVNVRAAVSGAGATPTGTVAITGADTNCTITLSDGDGGCNVIFNTAGAKTLTATYSGNTTYASSSDTESHTVSAGSATSTTAITADTPDPSASGQAVAVSVTVSGAGATPTGTVAVTGADTNCTITLSGGSGSCNVIFNTIGTKIITATYSGNSNYATSYDDTGHSVSQGISTTVITTDTPDPSVPFQTVTVSVTVSGGGTTPTGTVAITGADTNCTITLSGGSGSCNTVAFNTEGTKTLTATYSGDANYAISTGTASHAVKNATVTTITADTLDPSALDAFVAVTVTVSGGGTTPTGTVAITGSDATCTITLVAGTGSCNTAVFHTAGAKTLAATYSGDALNLGSADTESHTVSQGTTTTTINSDNPDPSAAGETVVVSVTVSGTGAATPTGTVAITGADINCTVTLVAGNGSCNATFSTSGAKTLTATYSGDGNYLVSSDTETHTVP